MRLIKSLVHSVAVLALVTGFSAPAIAQDTLRAISAESVIETIKKRGTIKIGLSLFKPWSMRSKKGDLVGFELDVGRKLAKDMGVEVEFVPTAWDGIIPALLTGKFDAIISGMSYTTKRALTVNFSDPYAYSGVGMLANIKLTKGFTLEDFNKPDVTFTARRGATPAALTKKNFPNATLLLFDEDGASGQEVINDNAHATLASEPYPGTTAATYSDVVYRPFPDHMFEQNGEGFVMRKGDPDAINFFNNWIAENWRNNFLQESHDYWFAGTDWHSLVDN